MTGVQTCALPIYVSLTQSMAALQAYKLIESVLEAGKPEVLAAPGGTFRTTDGLLTMAVITEEQWQRLCPALGRPELANDPRFASFPDRRANKDALMAAMHAAFATRGTEDWLTRLGKADILANRMNTYLDFLADPHVPQTEAVAWIEHPDVGRVPMAGIPAAPLPG